MKIQIGANYRTLGKIRIHRKIRVAGFTHGLDEACDGEREGDRERDGWLTLW